MLILTIAEKREWAVGLAEHSPDWCPTHVPAALSMQVYRGPPPIPSDTGSSKFDNMSKVTTSFDRG